MTPQEIYPLLSANSALAALVGDRIYPSKAPDGVDVPYVVWWEAGGSTEQTLADGIAVRFWRIRFGCWSKTYLEAVAIRDAIEEAICQQNLGTRVFSDADFDESTDLHRAIVDITIGKGA